MRNSRAPALPVVLLVDASLQQNAAGRNRRPTTEPRAGDRRCTAEQSAALPAADVVPRLDRAVPALADRRRSIKVGADIKKVARVAAVSGSHLAAARGVERRSLRCAGPLAPFFRVASWRRVCVELVGALSRDLRGEDAFLEDAAPGAIVEVFETVAPEREYTVPVAGEVFEPAPSFRPSDRGVPVRLRDNQHAWATNTGSWRRGRRGGGARFVMLI